MLATIAGKADLDEILSNIDGDGDPSVDRAKEKTWQYGEFLLTFASYTEDELRIHIEGYYQGCLDTLKS